MSSDRLAFTEALAQKAGLVALDYFRKLDTLTITQKGHQDLVSEADQNVETLIRDALSEAIRTTGSSAKNMAWKKARVGSPG
jgi:myo-inositol-1(or 4)-monophosphatase